MRSNYENEVSFPSMMELLYFLQSQKTFFETLKRLLKCVRLLLYIWWWQRNSYQLLFYSANLKTSNKVMKYMMFCRLHK
jgi:flagellar biosynthesis protein FlhB